MSYRAYAQMEFLLPASEENAVKLGVSQKDINEVLESGDGDWDDGIKQYLFDNKEVMGMVFGEEISIFLVLPEDYISTLNDAFEPDQVYFAFNFDELFTETLLCKNLKQLGMQQAWWVAWG